MYGLPDNLDLSFMIGRELIQVCFGANDLILNFDEDLSILITSRISYSPSSGGKKECDNYREAANAIACFLEHKILSVSGNDDGTLTLDFDDQLRLEVFDDSKLYESYVIKSSGEEIVV